jgi:exodeoxyribonuclease V alpha subunit
MNLQQQNPASNAMLVGTIERITFYNPDTGFSVMRIAPEGKIPSDALAVDGTVVVVGQLVELNLGERVEFAGDWIIDARYGKQFKAQIAQPQMPNSIDGLVAYLGSGLVKGIGPKTAAKIVKHFGDATLDVLDSAPERLHEILKPDFAAKLAESWSENVGVRRVMIFLQGYGVSPKMARRIHDVYKGDTVSIVSRNPYTLAGDVFGIGFTRADAIARRLGIAYDSPLRLRAGLSYALSQLSMEGHTFSPRRELISKTAELLDVADKQDVITALLDEEIQAENLISDRVVHPSDFAIYLPSYHEAETDAAERLKAMANGESRLMQVVRKLRAERLLDETAESLSVTLSDQQKRAVLAALRHKVVVMTGGPGTGKTTSIKTLIHMLEALEVRYTLASPTGRAAKRLAEATERNAFTIHRMLGYAPGEGFYYDEDNPIPIDMLIVDEASMVDLQLFDDLLKALRSEVHLFLVGDVDQLPSVGAGNVLRDVIDSQIAEVTRLQTIFRQDQDSDIVINAHRINEGETPNLNRSKDFFFFDSQDAQNAAELVVDIVVNRIPTKFGFDPMQQIQAIAPMYRGQAGVTVINNLLQDALNPTKPGQPQITVSGRSFRSGDKVMQTKNNYELDVFNGDIGFIRTIDVEDQLILVEYEGRLVEYESYHFDQLIHAYCISTHRSQGSEYPVVVMPVMTQHYMMLQRNLLYTAVTRAKKMVVLVGMRQAVAMAVRNDRVTRRYSGLLPRLQT